MPPADSLSQIRREPKWHFLKESVGSYKLEVNYHNARRVRDSMNPSKPLARCDGYR
jgi:hypothetical protein